MPRRLILIRHAKTKSNTGYADDHARVLTDSGKLDAHAIGAWLAAQGYQPDTILTSDATRTRQTTALIKRELETSPTAQEMRSLYLAAPQTMIDVGRAALGETIILIAHNPGIALLADQLLQTPPDNARFDSYPPGATTVINFAEADWCCPGKGEFIDFVVPSELTP